jgi:hypothetical protein
MFEQPGLLGFFYYHSHHQLLSSLPEEKISQIAIFGELRSVRHPTHTLISSTINKY